MNNTGSGITSFFLWKNMKFYFNKYNQYPKTMQIPNWNENIEGDNVAEGKTSQAKI